MRIFGAGLTQKDRVQRFFQDTVIAEAVALAGSRSPSLIGIDGCSGAGKSVLALQLCEQLPGSAVIVQGDDFYRLLPNAERSALSASEGYLRYFDWERLRDQVLTPVREGLSHLRYQRYDWDSDRMGAWVEVAMPSVVLVEGVYTLRPPLRPLIDVAIVVETSAEVRLARQLARGENSIDWIRRWAAAEQYYFDHHSPVAVADLVIKGE